MTTNKEGHVSINQFLTLTGLSNVYVRKQIKNGKIPSVLEPLKPGSKTMKRWIPEDTVPEWKGRSGKGNRREDGRTRWIIYLNDEEYEELKDKYPIVEPYYRRNK